MKRRQFVSLLGGVVAFDPATALAQTPSGPRRVGLMIATSADDAEGKLRVEAFVSSLGEAGWVDGRDVVVDVVFYRGSFPVAQIMAKPEHGI